MACRQIYNVGGLEGREMTGAARQTGVIVRWDESRGFGFAARAGGRDVFVHRRDMPRQQDRMVLAKGVRVAFTVTDQGRGPLAVAATVIGAQAHGRDSR